MGNKRQNAGNHHLEPHCSRCCGSPCRNSAQAWLRVASEPEVLKLKTFALVPWQAENDGQVGVSLSPTVIPTRRALLVRLLITCHTLDSLGVNLYDSRLRSKKQEVRNGLQSLAFPSYLSGVPTHGSEIILGSGRIAAEDSSVGTVNERGWVDISCCNWAKRDAKALASGFCRNSGICSSLLNWLSVLLGHIFNSLRLVPWRRRCCWVHDWTDCTLTNCVWNQLQQKNSAPKEQVQRFTETLANRQAFQKHSCTRLVQGWRGFGTKMTTA